MSLSATRPQIVSPFLNLPDRFKNRVVLGDASSHRAELSLGLTPDAFDERRPAAEEHARRAYFIPRLFTRNAHWSAASSISFEVGLPAPWPARVSMRINVGASPD